MILCLFPHHDTLAISHPLGCAGKAVASERRATNAGITTAQWRPFIGKGGAKGEGAVYSQ